MRNALYIDDLVITADNSGAIGQKALDHVNVPDAMTSYFSARVTLLEQLAASAIPSAIIMLNFSSEEAWPRYVKGIEQLFEEAGLEMPNIQGSTESNIPTLQSAIGLTMIGKKTNKKSTNSLEDLKWYSYGLPFVGDELIANLDKIADLKKIIVALNNDVIEHVIPVGSKGLKFEVQQLLDYELESGHFPFDIEASAGPSTVVIFGVQAQKTAEFESCFSSLTFRIK